VRFLLSGGQARRTVLDLPGAGEVAVLGLRDLVQSKKTQRDKDWGHIRRLVEADYLARRDEAKGDDVAWWLPSRRLPPLARRRHPPRGGRR